MAIARSTRTPTDHDAIWSSDTARITTPSFELKNRIAPTINDMLPPTRSVWLTRMSPRMIGALGMPRSIFLTLAPKARHDAAEHDFHAHRQHDRHDERLADHAAHRQTRSISVPTPNIARQATARRPTSAVPSEQAIHTK